MTAGSAWRAGRCEHFTEVWQQRGEEGWGWGWGLGLYNTDEEGGQQTADHNNDTTLLAPACMHACMHTTLSANSHLWACHSLFHPPRGRSVRKASTLHPLPPHRTHHRDHCHTTHARTSQLGRSALLGIVLAARCRLLRRVLGSYVSPAQLQVDQLAHQRRQLSGGDAHLLRAVALAKRGRAVLNSLQVYVWGERERCVEESSFTGPARGQVLGTYEALYGSDNIDSPHKEPIH